jgi:uncharacterized membrane protein YhhN
VILAGAVVAAGVVGALVGEARQERVVGAVGKLAASLGFLGAYVASGLAWRGVAGGLLGVALLASAVGDALLLGRSRRSFQVGILAFLAGHLAFGAMLVVVGVEPRWTAAGCGVVAGLAWAVWRWLGPHVDRLRSAVRAYVAVISTMVALAVGACAVDPGRRWGLLVSAVVFFVSDLFVARNRFVRASATNRYIGLPLYYGAQLGWIAAVLAAT